MTITFIGDVHGWSDRLDRVLDQAEGDVVMMGDLIDRGPDAPGVLARVRALVDQGRVRCLMGNHEYALVRGLGVPELGIPSEPMLYVAWVQRYGGQAVLDAYGLPDDDPVALRRSLGDHLPWMASLPWILEDRVGDRTWLAVHAGLGSRDFRTELIQLRDPLAMLRAEPVVQPPALYAKPRAWIIPSGFPGDWCLVSGHTPLAKPHITAQRILCDTSGGLPGRTLSGVIWPEGRVIGS